MYGISAEAKALYALDAIIMGASIAAVSAVAPVFIVGAGLPRALEAKRLTSFNLVAPVGQVLGGVLLGAAAAAGWSFSQRFWLAAAVMLLAFLVTWFTSKEPAKRIQLLEDKPDEHHEGHKKSIGLGQVLLLSGNYWVGVYFTPFQWTGYILLMDGLHRKLSGGSLISDHFGEFLLLLVISIGSWLIFEAYNLLLKNWTYVGLPDSRLLRYLGYGWSFATISPGIFLTYQVLNDLLPGSSPPPKRPRLGGRLFTGLTGLGPTISMVPDSSSTGAAR